jgi:adenine nucleotide transporter 17
MIKLIYNQEGLSGFFKGIVPSLILTLVPVMQFTCYEVLKKSFMDKNGDLSNKHLVLISFLSKLVTIIVSYPLMTAKALYQSNSKLPSCEVWKIIVKLIKEEGLLGFYKGFGPKVVGSLINNTILMFTYERVQVLVRIILMKIILGKRSRVIAN